MAAAVSSPGGAGVRAMLHGVLAVLAFAAVMLVVPDRPVPPTVRGDDYPFKVWSSEQADPWGFAARSCASFVAWRLNQVAGRVEPPWYVEASHVGDRTVVGGLGDASTWDERLRAAGFRVDETPARGSVAQWDANEGSGVGYRGHVAYVVEVYRDGSVLVEEYDRWNGFDAHRTRAPRYLHLADVR